MLLWNIENIMQKTKTRHELKSDIGSDRRIKFCEAYVIDLNASKAALKAGYAESGHGVEGHRLLKNAKCLAYIQYLQGNIAESVGITKEKVVREVAKLAFSDMANIHDGWLTLKEFNELTEEQMASISEISSVKKKTIDENGDPEYVDMVKIKLHDKHKALETLNKMLGYNEPEKIDHSGDIQLTPIDFVRTKPKDKD